MKQIIAGFFFLIMIAGASCKKEGVQPSPNIPAGSYSTRVTCINAETNEPIGGLRIQYGRLNQPVPDSSIKITQQDGSFSLIDYYENSFETSPYFLNLPGYFNFGGFMLYNPPVVLKNQDEIPDGYLFSYFPEFQKDRFREYRIPVYGLADLKLELKQDNPYLSQHPDGYFFIKFYTVYMDISKGWRAEEGNADILSNQVNLRGTALLDSVVHLPVLAGLDCEIRWKIFEVYTPDIVPPGVDPGWYEESVLVKTGIIETKKYKSGTTNLIHQNF